MRALLGFAKWLTAFRQAEDVASALARSVSRACSGCDVEVCLGDPGRHAVVWWARASSGDDVQVVEESLDEVEPSVGDMLKSPVGSVPASPWMALERPDRRIGLIRVADVSGIREDVLDIYNELVTFWFESRKSLLDAEERLGALNRLASSARLFVLSSDGRILLMSDAMASLTGHRVRDLVGRPFEEWIGPEWIQFHRSLERVMAGIPTDSFEAPVPGLGDTAQNLVFLAHRSDSGALFVIGFSVRQIEAMGRVAMHTARLSTMAQIASGLMAELEDPVTSIKVQAESMRESIEERWGRKDMLSQIDDILAGVGRLAKLAHDLVSYAHSFDEEPSEISINALCEEALGICHSLIVEKKARVRTALAGVVPSFMGSAGQIRQALVNVITNALQSLGEDGGGIVVRSWDNRDGTIGVSIADTGVGMDEDQLAGIFEPFYSTRNSVGLGMSLVRDVVSMHGGTVEVDSEPGEGTVVTMTLPVGDVSSEPVGFDDVPFDDTGNDVDLTEDMDLLSVPKEDKKPLP